MVEIEYAHPQVQIRYAIMPKHALDPIYQELSLDKELIMKMIEEGKSDALEAIKQRNKERHG